MMNKPFWLAVLAYLLPTFPLGYFWHLVTFADRYHQLAMYRDDAIIPLGLASMTIQALLFAWAYPRLVGDRAASWRSGALGFGLFFGALAWSYAVLPVAAKYRMSSVPARREERTTGAAAFLQSIFMLRNRPSWRRPCTVSCRPIA